MASFLWVCMFLGTIGLISGGVIETVGVAPKTLYTVTEAPATGTTDKDVVEVTELSPIHDEDVTEILVLTTEGPIENTPITDVPITLAPGDAQNANALAEEEGPIDHYLGEFLPAPSPTNCDVDLTKLKNSKDIVRCTQHRRSVENPSANEEIVTSEAPPVIVPTVAPVVNEENISSVAPVVTTESTTEVPLEPLPPIPSVVPVPDNNTSSAESLESIEMEEVEIVFVIPAANHTGNNASDHHHHHHPSSESVEDHNSVNGTVTNGTNHTHSHSLESSEEDNHPHIAHIFFYSSVFHFPSKENSTDVKVDEPELVSKL